MIFELCYQSQAIETDSHWTSTTPSFKTRCSYICLGIISVYLVGFHGGGFRENLSSSLSSWPWVFLDLSFTSHVFIYQSADYCMAYVELSSYLSTGKFGSIYPNNLPMLSVTNFLHCNLSLSEKNCVCQSSHTMKCFELNCTFVMHRYILYWQWSWCICIVWLWSSFCLPLETWKSFKQRYFFFFLKIVKII